jgi:nitrite reductase (NADH) large subunit
MARLHVLDLDPRTTRLWAIGRHGGMIGLAALLATLVLAPDPALRTLWNIAVPLLPATFFLTPALWRGVCPLSTINALGNRVGRPRDMTDRETAVIGALGLVLFHLIVPARHLGLNTDGPLLAGALLAIGALALAMGAVYSSRSAFCNALCPVLPVERLYGQAPVLGLERGRCGACTVCTPRGCIDLADRKAMRQLLGAPRHGRTWLSTPFGIFAAALPGFIIAYYATPDLGFGSAVRVYATTLGASLASYALVSALVIGTAARPMRAIAGCAALSGALYYWYTAAVITRNLALPPMTVPVIRTVALLGIAAWTWRTLRQDATPA